MFSFILLLFISDLQYWIFYYYFFLMKCCNKYILKCSNKCFTQFYSLHNKSFLVDTYIVICYFPQMFLMWTHILLILFILDILVFLWIILTPLFCICILDIWPSKCVKVVINLSRYTRILCLIRNWMLYRILKCPT